MGEINSPIGKTSFKSQPVKTWAVDDASAQDFEIPSGAQQQGPPPPEVYENLTPQQVQQLRRDFANQTNQNHPYNDNLTKRRLEILCNIGRGTKDITVETPNGKVSYSLRTLKGREQYEVSTVAEQLKHANENGEFAFTASDTHTLRLTVLKHSLYAVDNTDIDVILGITGQSYEKRVELRRVFLDEIDEALLVHLFNAYQQLVMDNLGKFKLDTEASLKEVSEEVKKSS